VLERFEVSVPEEQQALLATIDPEWAKFQVMLDDVAAKLDKSKESFREKVKHMVDTFVKEVAQLGDEFTKSAPFSHDKITTRSAMQYIAAWKDQAAAARQKVRLHHASLSHSWGLYLPHCTVPCRCTSVTLSAVFQAADLRPGMDIFNIQQPPYKELANTEKDLDFLEKIWGIVQEWQSNYNGWKDGKFRDIKVSISFLAVYHYARLLFIVVSVMFVPASCNYSAARICAGTVCCSGGLQHQSEQQRGPATPHSAALVAACCRWTKWKKLPCALEKPSSNWAVR
jgi:hypothetical protein